MNRQRVTFHTLGCKLNFAETSTIGRQFTDRGFTEVPNEEPADVIVINTCSVTDRADQKARQLIRHFQKTSPDAFTIVTGCYAQLDPDSIAGISGVDLVLGSNEKFHLFDYIQSFERTGASRVITSPIEEVHEYGGAYSLEVGNRTRVFLKVQDGCDYVCTYCTIPLARGTSRNPSIGEIINQAKSISASGAKEIVLSGVNVGDFGRKTGETFLDLLKRLEQESGIDRIRISSIEPNLLTDEIIRFVAASDRFCRHFHVPMQSGSDTILKRMKRRYLTEDYRNRIKTIHSEMPDAGIGADVIVGFPGETDALFAETATFIAGLPLTYLHVFTYSERTNTPAAEMTDQVSAGIRKKRNATLRILSRQKEHDFLSTAIGTVQSVLIEGDHRDGYQFGYTGNYMRVGVMVPSSAENTIINVRITGFLNDQELVGTVL